MFHHKIDQDALLVTVADLAVTRLQQSAAAEIVAADDALRTGLAAYQATGA